MKSFYIVSTPYACISRRESLSPSIAVGEIKAFLKSQDVDVTEIPGHLLFYNEFKKHDDWDFLQENFSIPVVYGYGLDMLYMSLVEGISDNDDNMVQLLRTYHKYKQSQRYFNFNIFSNKLIEFRKNLDSFIDKLIASIDFSNNPIITFSCIHGQMFSSLHMAKKIKQLNPNCKIVFGGIDCMGATTKMILERYNFVDAIGIDEGEFSLLKFVQADGCPKSIPGLAYKNEQGDIEEIAPDKQVDLKKLPVPDFADFFAALDPNDRDEVTIPILGSRGCPWNKCNFCNIPLDQHFGYRCKTAEQVIQEITFYHTQYPESFEYVMADADISISENFYATLSHYLKGKNLLFSGHSRADRLTRKMVEAMRECGFYGIEVGIEAFSDDILDLINKGTNVADNIKALKLLRENEIVSWSNIIPYYPKSTAENVKETISVIEKIKHLLYGSELYLSNFTLYPRCEIWNEASSWGIRNIELEVCDFLPGYNVENGSWYTVHKFEHDVSKTSDLWEIVEEKLSIYRSVFHPCFFRYINKQVIVYDYRNNGIKKITALDEISSQLFLACSDLPQTKQQMMHKCEVDNIDQLLNNMINIDILYVSKDKFYFALPTKIYPAIETFLAERVEIDAYLMEDPFKKLYPEDSGSDDMSSNKALLIIDMQKALVDNEYMHSLSGKIRDYINANGEEYHSIYFVVFKNDAKSLFYTMQNYHGCIESPDIDLPDELLEFANLSNVFYNTAFSAFSNKDLVDTLRRNGITDVDIVGIETDGCVLTSAMGAFDHNIRPNVIGDLCASSCGPEVHEAGMQSFYRHVVEQS